MKDKYCDLQIKYLHEILFQLVLSLKCILMSVVQFPLQQNIKTSLFNLSYPLCVVHISNFLTFMITLQRLDMN